MKRKEIKKKAKKILEGKKGHAIGMTLKVMMIYWLIICTLTIVGGLISTILNVGVLCIYALVTINFVIKLDKENRKVKLGELLPSFDIARKYIVISFICEIVLVLITLPLASMIDLPFFENIIIALMIGIASTISVCIVLTTPIIFMPYILIEEPEISLEAALRRGLSISFNNLGSIIIMQLTLVPWYLFAIITLGLGTSYVTPYVNAVFYVMYKEIEGESAVYYN